MTQISAVNLFTENEVLKNKTITIANGLIREISDCTKKPEFQNLAPALFDTHINGGEKYHFTQENSELGITDLLEASQKTGTHYVLPCLITSSLPTIKEGLDAVKIFMSKKTNSGVLGMHLEGPFLNPIKRGAHLAKYLQKPTMDLIDEILEHGRGIIKLWTIAPELFSSEQIQRIQEAGIILAAGHSNATYEESCWSFNQGINLVTHLYNAMSGLHHRKPGLVGAALSQEVWAPIILDGFHSDYGAAKVAYKAKKDKLFLISDALFLGGKMTNFQWEEFDASLIDGEYRNSEGNLAGSAISLPECIKNAIEKVGIPLSEAIDMATIRPARALKMDDKIGKIAIDYPAIFTSFDNKLENFKIIKPAN